MSGRAGTLKTNFPAGKAVYKMDKERLLSTKQRIAARDESLQPAFAKLLADAESALSAGPFSVIDKTLTPPSGDKHDYISFGPYWWPDPTTPSGLPYIRKDGLVNPESRTGADWLSLHNMATAVTTLVLASYLDDNETCARRAAMLLRTWFLDPESRMNPHLQYGQAIPGRVDGRGTGIIDTMVLPPVVDVIELLGDLPALTGEETAELRAWFARYLAWLLTSEHGKEEQAARSNHGTWYDVQVVRFALFTGDTDLARKTLASVNTRRIALQIMPNGAQPSELARTRSFGYSVMNLTGMVRLAEMAEALGIDLWHFQTPDGRCLRAALDYLAPYADRNLQWPHKQIEEVNQLSLLPLLLAGRRAYPSAKYEEMIACLPEEAVRRNRAWLL